MSQRARLLEETRKAFERRVGERAAATERGAAPPAPGDLYVLEHAAAGGVEWAVLATDPAERGVLAVPADAGTLVGTGDVEILETSPGGPLTLRCRFATRLGAELFEPRRRRGLLDPGDVARARRRWSEIESGVSTSSVLEREVDEDPDYQDWVDHVVAPALRALEGTPRPAPPMVADLEHRNRGMLGAGAPRQRSRRPGRRRVSGVRALARDPIETTAAGQESYCQSPMIWKAAQ